MNQTEKYPTLEIEEIELKTVKKLDEREINSQTGDLKPKSFKQEQIVMASKVIGSIFAIIGLIFVWMMVSDMLDFAAALEQLRNMYDIPSSVFYGDPQISAAISEGYWMLAKDKLIVFLPMFIIAGVVIGAGKKLTGISQDR